MSYITRHRVALLATTSGGAVQNFFTSAVLSGQVEAIKYTRATASAIATGAHITITAEFSGLTILTATATGDVTWYPRAGAMDTSAVALGFSSGAAPPIVPTMIPLAQERMKIALSSAGTASNGGLAATVDLYLSGVQG